jgi:hypothetical protein
MVSSKYGVHCTNDWPPLNVTPRPHMVLTGGPTRYDVTDLSRVIPRWESRRFPACPTRQGTVNNYKIREKKEDSGHETRRATTDEARTVWAIRAIDVLPWQHRKLWQPSEHVERLQYPEYRQRGKHPQHRQLGQYPEYWKCRQHPQYWQLRQDLESRKQERPEKPRTGELGSSAL